MDCQAPGAYWYTPSAAEPEKNPCALSTRTWLGKACPEFPGWNTPPAYRYGPSEVAAHRVSAWSASEVAGRESAKVRFCHAPPAKLERPAVVPTQRVSATCKKARTSSPASPPEVLAFVKARVKPIWPVPGFSVKSATPPLVATHTVSPRV